MKKPGYIIPPNPEPDNLRCIKVFVPDDPLYVAAFVGALTYFGTWTAWELDEDKRARIAARVWKDANDVTFDRMGESCDCDEPETCEVCEMTKDELIEAFLEVMDMNINVNCGGCGCGGCGCGDKNQPPQDYQTMPPLTGKNPSPIDTNGLQHKCNAANYLIYTLRTAGINSVNWGAGYESWQDFWADLFFFLDDPNLTTFAYYPYVTILSLINGVSNTDSVVAPFDARYNELVCTIYSAANSQDAATSLLAKIDEVYADYVVRFMMKEIARELPFDLAFLPEYASEVPSSFQGRDCSVCGISNEDLPVLNDPNFYWAEVRASHITNFALLGTAGITISGEGNLFTMKKTQTSQRADTIVLDVDMLKIQNDGAVEDIRKAFLVRFLSATMPTTTDNTNLNNHVSPVNVPPNSRCGWTNTNRYQFRYRSGHLESSIVSSITDQLGEYGAAAVAMAGGSEDVMGANIGCLLNSANSSETATFRLWYLVERV